MKMISSLKKLIQVMGNAITIPQASIPKKLTIHTLKSTPRTNIPVRVKDGVTTILKRGRTGPTIANSTSQSHVLAITRPTPITTRKSTSQVPLQSLSTRKISTLMLKASVRTASLEVNMALIRHWEWIPRIFSISRFHPTMNRWVHYLRPILWLLLQDPQTLLRKAR